jgi:carbonic anhydrase
VAKISFIQEEWENNEFPYIHGWVYDLKDGLLKDLKISINTAEQLGKVYQYEPQNHTEQVNK